MTALEKKPYQLKTIYDLNGNVLCQGHYESYAKMVQENKRSLMGANLKGKDLRGADLRGAMFEYADLRGVKLDGADTRGIYIKGAKLWGIGKDGDFRGYGMVAYQKGIHRIVAIAHPYDVMWWCDNFWGNSEEFVAFFDKKGISVKHLVNRTKCDWDYED